MNPVIISALEIGLWTSCLSLRKNISQGARMDYRLRHRPLTPTFLYCWGPLLHVVPYFLSSLYYCYLIKALNGKEYLNLKKQQHWKRLQTCHPLAKIVVWFCKSQGRKRELHLLNEPSFWGLTWFCSLFGCLLFCVLNCCGRLHYSRVSFPLYPHAKINCKSTFWSRY